MEHKIFSQMENDAKQIKSISTHTCSKLLEKKDLIVETVNTQMSRRPDIHRLIGYNPLQMMYDNHRNHFNLIIQVLKLQEIDILINMIPWVYRTYHIHGFDYDYFPIAFQHWIKAIEDHLESNMAQSVSNIYHFLIKWHPAIVELVETNRDIGLSFYGDLQKEHEQFLHYLLQGDYKNCLLYSEKIVKTPTDLAPFYLQVIQPALYRVGFLWQIREISVAVEHLSTAIIGRIMASLYTRFPLIDTKYGNAIISSAPNEFHEVGGRIVADLLEMEGWNVDFIGANVPPQELLEYVKKKRPFLVGLSVTMPYHIDSASQIISLLKNDPDLASTKIMVGGLAFFHKRNLWQKTGADGWAPHGLEAIRLANSWWHEVEFSNV